jgi:hypothetical protein
MTTRVRTRSHRSRAVPAAAVLLAAVTFAAACTHHRHLPWPPRQTTPSTAPAHHVTVELGDGTIAIGGDIAAGSTVIDATNVGTHEHEVIFIKADSASALPTKADGSVDEAKLPARSAIGEMELDAGRSASKAFTFTPGKWVAVCNGDEGHSHFADGMYREFTVS